MLIIAMPLQFYYVQGNFTFKNSIFNLLKFKIWLRHKILIGLKKKLK